MAEFAGCPIALFFLGSIDTVLGQSVVKIGFVPSESFAPLFVAHERGYFKAQGLTTELVRLPSGAAILTQVVTGDIQVGGGALGAAAFNAANQKLAVAFVAPMHFAYIEDYSGDSKSGDRCGPLQVGRRPARQALRGQCQRRGDRMGARRSIETGWDSGSTTSTSRRCRFPKCCLPSTTAPFFVALSLSRSRPRRRKKISAYARSKRNPAPNRCR